MANSGLRMENTFVKVAGHHRRLWSVNPQLQQRPLFMYTSLTAGVFSKERSPQGQVCIDHVVCHRANNRVVSVIEEPEAIVDAKGIPAGMCI